MAFLEVKNLTRIYGKKENALVALDHVSFAVDKGEFIAVTGASGSANLLCCICLVRWTSRRRERCFLREKIS